MTSIAPIRKQIIVDAPRERAFRVFTENMDVWWPREHHIGKAELKEAVLEPRTNGRWYGSSSALAKQRSRPAA